MKALSMRQPMAWFAAAGYKPVETRTWRTNFRGPLHIHASGKWGKAERETFHAILDSGVFDPKTVAFLEQVEANAEHEVSMQYTGGIIGLVDLVGCDKFVSAFDFRSFVQQHLCVPKLGYDWQRYGWEIRDAQFFVQPIECKGALSLWTPPPSVIAKIEKAKILSSKFRIGTVNVR